MNGAELSWAIKAGMTPLAAIEAATANAAETLGVLAPKKGVIQEGWDADLISLDENPLENFELFREADNIKFIWKAGHFVKSPDQEKKKSMIIEEQDDDWSVVAWK